MDWMTALAQIPTEAFLERVMDAQLQQILQVIGVLAIIFLIVSAVAVITVARLIGRHDERQNDTLAAERKEKQAALNDNRALNARLDTVEKQLTEVINDAKLAKLAAEKDREHLTLRLNIAEERATRFENDVAKLTNDLNAERNAEREVLAENERLREQNSTLKADVARLETRITDLEEKRRTDEQPVVTTVKESQIDTSPLADNGTVQKSLQEKGE